MVPGGPETQLESTAANDAGVVGTYPSPKVESLVESTGAVQEGQFKPAPPPPAPPVPPAEPSPLAKALEEDLEPAPQTTAPAPRTMHHEEASTPAPQTTVSPYDDLDDEPGQNKFGYDVVAQPSTWAPSCMRIVPAATAHGPVLSDGQNLTGLDEGVLVMAPCSGAAGERLVWTTELALRTIKPICLDATGLEVGDVLAVRPCVRAAPGQHIRYRRVGRWRRFGELSMVGGSGPLCLTAPLYGNPDRRVRLQNCGEPDLSCRQMFVANAPPPSSAPEEMLQPRAGVLAPSVLAEPHITHSSTFGGMVLWYIHPCTLLLC